MRSPGRPPVAGRAEQQRFWKAIARGLSSEDAAVSCGVSPPVGGRWFREGGGMPPISLSRCGAPIGSDQHLSVAEREEIAILRARARGGDIARRLRGSVRAGGMPPISLAPRSARYLSVAEREEIAIASRNQGAGVRDHCHLGSGEPRRLSRESCVATRRLGAAVWRIGRRLRSGTAPDVPSARRSPSWPRTIG